MAASPSLTSRALRPERRAGAAWHPWLAKSCRSRVRAIGLRGHGRRDGACERRAEMLRALERELDGDAGARPECRAHEIERDRLLQERVMRVIVGNHRAIDPEPADLALAGALDADDLDDRGAHGLPQATPCFFRNAQTFCQPSSACSIRYIGRS